MSAPVKPAAKAKATSPSRAPLSTATMNHYRLGARAPTWLVFWRYFAFYCSIMLWLLESLVCHGWTSDRWVHKRLARHSRRVLRAAGVRIHVRGEFPREPTLLVANHLSWVDILALCSADGLHFVAKEELRHWPIVGRAMLNSRAIFLRRASASAIKHLNRQLEERLKTGQKIAIFPEGGIYPGIDIHHFSPAIFQVAINAKIAVQPIAIRYYHDNKIRSFAASYAGNISIGESLGNLLRAARTNVDLCVLPRQLTDIDERQVLAERCRELIRSAYTLHPCPPELTLESTPSVAPETTAT